MRRIPEQPVELLEARNDLLPARGRIAADHLADAGAEQFETERAVACEIARWIDHDRFERHRPGGFRDFAKGEQRAVQHRARDDAIRPRRREHHADTTLLPRHPPQSKQKTPTGCEAEGALATNWTRLN